MFKITSYRKKSDKILITIETDDQAAADFCRFFGAANKFVDLFHYRMRSAKSFDLYQKTAPHKMALHKKEIAEQLEQFRSMPGSRIERMRILKEIRVSNGDRVTLDQIDVELRHAKQYDKGDNLLILKSLVDGGKSLNDIVKTMNLPKSTVARMIKQLRPTEPPPEEASLAPESVSRSDGA
jgi:hypothetical protein